jgi:hypothetical protein
MNLFIDWIENCMSGPIRFEHSSLISQIGSNLSFTEILLHRASFLQVTEVTQIIKNGRGT